MTLRALIPLISLVSTLVLSGLVIGLHSMSLRQGARRDSLFRLKDRLDKLEGELSRLDLDNDGMQVKRNIFQFSEWRAVECAWLLHKVSSSSAPLIEASLNRRDLHSVIDSSLLESMGCQHLQPFIGSLGKEPFKKGVKTKFCNKDSKLFGGLRLSPERFVIVGVDLEKTLSSREDEIFFAASVLVGSFSTYFFLLFLFLNRQLYRRAMKLLNTSRALRLGDWSARSKLKGVDELGMLSESFDAMADQLQAQNKELSVLNDQLEIKVEERSR
jgi:HAMP domain-containing protein